MAFSMALFNAFIDKRLASHCTVIFGVRSVFFFFFFVSLFSNLAGTYNQVSKYCKQNPDFYIWYIYLLDFDFAYFLLTSCRSEFCKNVLCKYLN